MIAHPPSDSPKRMTRKVLAPLVSGCYICQPDNPSAAEEGCEACDRDYWAHVLAPTEEDYRETGIVHNPRAL